MVRLVALTGATGFVGSHAVRAFADAGWHVRVLARRLPSNPILAPAGAELILGDLDDAPALGALVRDADVVVHAAGAVRARDAIGFYRANAQGTAGVVSAVRSTAPQARFVFVSSLSAREPALSDYAGSKRAGEIELERAGQEIDWSIIRPPAVYGPGDRELLPFFRMAQGGWLAAPANGNARLSLIHAGDLARAILTLASSTTCRGATLEVDDGRDGGYGWPDIAAALGDAVGRRVRLVRVPRLPVLALATLIEAQARRHGRAPMANRGKVREFWHPDWVARGSEFRVRTNWIPQVSLEKGFSDTFRSLHRAGLLHKQAV